MSVFHRPCQFYVGHVSFIDRAMSVLSIGHVSFIDRPCQFFEGIL